MNIEEYRLATNAGYNNTTKKREVMIQIEEIVSPSY
jgi:hypothetical protein